MGGGRFDIGTGAIIFKTRFRALLDVLSVFSRRRPFSLRHRRISFSSLLFAFRIRSTARRLMYSVPSRRSRNRPNNVPGSSGSGNSFPVHPLPLYRLHPLGRPALPSWSARRMGTSARAALLHLREDAHASCFPHLDSLLRAACQAAPDASSALHHLRILLFSTVPASLVPFPENSFLVFHLHKL